MRVTIPKDIDVNFLKSQSQLILDSYQKWTGKTLLPSTSASPETYLQLFSAPFPVLSSTHDAEPVLNYGNQTALDLWEMDWTSLTNTLGKNTAEAMERDTREKFLQTVREKGFIDNYSGIRISRTGKRFRIENATVWNLVDSSGAYSGQAATFTHWTFL